MQLAFQKAFQTCKNGEKIPFLVQSDDKKAQLEGVLFYEKGHFNLLKLKGILKGSITLICDISGEEYEKILNEPLEFYLSDGIINLDNENFEDVIECENGNINLSEILNGELEIIRCDYHTKDD
ncbi:hypothetical protein [Helicobacter winghamensis]|uniref:DUF177 domain-containing protein n=1 Tax=Helicobacter winghamensis TaxID=157268 RepID=A0A2N3PHW5_9HELI|nr:hypothetical protein [Helicobacter winghamensis]EEO25603.1 hypothetical protein HWAG_00395 [Helicobacter winghamensis ATCC BAA-430]PKT77989.1 hypothetical protein BCM34_01860 [Helicobacter winghamensis]PKT78251.1 hypothetical protein BCM32_00610 [Helicobacter winghamensis]PKT78517.1 hypothetical protein BCM35_00150 [Helicobacter winghamensis]PKT80154.1 hypothetical protein BCM31_00525 [Helicobacter winghamensis]